MNILKIVILTLLTIPVVTYAQDKTINSDEFLGKEFAQMSEFANGTGFLISNNGYIVTCHHVIEDAKTVTHQGYQRRF